MKAEHLVVPTLAQPVELHTKRCVLRPWQDRDLAPWCAMNADADVRRYFSNIATEEQARGEAQRCSDAIAQRGWGMWALEVPGVFPFAGFVGLAVPRYDAPWIPAVEIGWRLMRSAWGKGLATEAAQAALDFGFSRLALPEIVAITAPSNTPSRRVMDRLGLVHDEAGDFDHPRIEAGHPLQRQVLYRKRRAA
jgi:RimJ/RimL family protein N-acetyltransferase